MFRLCLSVVLCLSPITIKADSFPDPFGLSWNMSTNDLTDIGFYYNDKIGPNDQFDELYSTSVPKPWAKGKRYRATIYHDKILKLEVESTLITDDQTGSAGKDLYGRIVSLMTTKYGDPSFVRDGRVFERTDLYDGIGEFYQCILSSVCMYMTTFDVSDGYIIVWLQATEQGAGFVTIGYESPDMGEAIAEAKNPDAVDFYASEDEVF